MKDKFRRLYGPVRADEGLVQHTLQAAQQQERRKLPGLMLICATTAILLVVTGRLFFTQPAPTDHLSSNGEVPGSTDSFTPVAGLASVHPDTTPEETVSPPVYQAEHSRLDDPFVQTLLAEKVPDLSDAFLPVGLCISHDGITFEVVAACRDKGLPVILTAITGERVDANTTVDIGFEPRLFSEYSMPNGYDEATQTKYIITICKRGQSVRTGQDIGIYLHNLEYRSPYEYAIQRTLELSAHRSTASGQTIRVFRMDYPEDFLLAGGYIIDTVETNAAVLSPGEPLLAFPCGAVISGIGVLDGKLHVQTRTPSDAGFLSIAIMPRSAAQYSVSYAGLLESHMYWQDESGAYGYAEYVFRIDPDSLGDYMLRTTYRAPGDPLEGEWHLTFSMP